LNETVEQLQRISDLLGQINSENLSAYAYSIELWLTGEFRETATHEWKMATRREQATMYIEWLEEWE
jgi:hypothetical protein